MGTLDDALGGLLVQHGLERLEAQALYRGSIDSETSPGQQQNVFVSLQDDSRPEVMSPIGLADQLGDHDVASSRTEGDGCGITVIASYAVLTRPLDMNRIVGEPGTIIRDAVALASYADLVQRRLTSRQERKEELLGLIQSWLSATDLVSNGQVSVAVFLETVEDVLELVPQPGLLAQIHDVASRTSLLDWARDESGSPLSAGLWSQITDGLELIRAQRGWNESEGTSQ